MIDTNKTQLIGFFGADPEPKESGSDIGTLSHTGMAHFDVHPGERA
jgi:hypothetical protein